MRIILIAILTLLPISAFAATATQHPVRHHPLHHMRMSAVHHPVTGKRLHPVTGKKLHNVVKPAKSVKPAAKPTS
jgi:hypothetical protein